MFVRNLLMMLGAAVMLFVTSWKLAALVLLGVPATLVPILLLGRRVRRLSRASQDRVADVSALRRRGGARGPHGAGLRARGRGPRRVRARTPRPPTLPACARIGQKAFLIAAVMLIAFCAVGVILWVGGHDVLAGRMTAGELSAFVFYAVVVGDAARARSPRSGASCSAPPGATERLFELLDARPAIVAPAAPQPAPPAPRGDRVRRRELRLPGAARHAGARPASRCAVAPGERVALVGSLGRRQDAPCSRCCCASTTRRRARCRIDGVDLRDMDPRALRRLVAVVPQEPVIFAASVLDNVRYGRPEADARGSASAPASRRSPGVRRAAAAGPGHAARRARRDALGRAAPAPVDRARAARRPAAAAARRGDQLARRRERAHGAAGARSARARPHHAGHRAPPRHGAARRPHRGAGPRRASSRRARTRS